MNVPFTGQTGSKLPPALVVSAESFHGKLLDAILCPISSQPRYYTRPGTGDVPLEHWAKIGLRHSSTASLSNLVAVERALIKRVTDSMPPEDLARVEATLEAAFGL